MRLKTRIVASLLSWSLLLSVPVFAHTANDGLHTSIDGMAFIKDHEGFRARPYKDSGGWAVAYGMHYWNGRLVTRFYPTQVTRTDADERFAAQLVRFENIVKSSIVVPLTQRAFDALVSMAYNLGRVNSRIIERLAAKRQVELRDFLSTATVNGRRCADLVARRRHEFELFAGR